MKIKEELKKARNRQCLTQCDLSERVPISREMIAKIETGTRKLPNDLRSTLAEALDDVEFFFASWNDAAGEVSIPFFDGEHIDQHPSSMVFLVKLETSEALERLSGVSWIKPIHTRSTDEKEEMKKLLFELLDSAASMINLVAVICREYGFSLRKIFKQWRLTLKIRKYQK